MCVCVCVLIVEIMSLSISLYQQDNKFGISILIPFWFY